MADPALGEQSAAANPEMMKERTNAEAQALFEERKQYFNQKSLFDINYTSRNETDLAKLQLNSTGQCYMDECYEFIKSGAYLYHDEVILYLKGSVILVQADSENPRMTRK